MLERALLYAAIMVAAVLVISEVGERFHPIALAAQAMAAPACQADGWGDATCANS